MSDEKEIERRIDLAKTIGSIESDVGNLKRMVGDMHGLMMDNGGPGFMSRFAKLALHIKIQWWFIGAIILSILSSAAWVVKAGLTK